MNKNKKKHNFMMLRNRIERLCRINVYITHTIIEAHALLATCISVPILIKKKNKHKSF